MLLPLSLLLGRARTADGQIEDCRLHTIHRAQHGDFPCELNGRLSSQLETESVEAREYHLSNFNIKQ